MEGDLNRKEDDLSDNWSYNKVASVPGLPHLRAHVRENFNIKSHTKAEKAWANSSRAVDIG